MQRILLVVCPSYGRKVLLVRSGAPEFTPPTRADGRRKSRLDLCSRPLQLPRGCKPMPLTGPEAIHDTLIAPIKGRSPGGRLIEDSQSLTAFRRRISSAELAD
jgi:hypothetical protein